MTKSARAGFTLIELLVTMTVTMLLVGGGIAAFITFNDRQTVQNGAKELQTHLRSAQTKARAGEKPAACTRLNGYRVQLTANSGQVVLTAVCSNGNIAHSTHTLPGNVVSAGSHTITFGNLYGGMTIVGSNTLAVISNPANLTDYRYEFEVKNGGEITAGDFDDN